MTKKMDYVGTQEIILTGAEAELYVNIALLKNDISVGAMDMDDIKTGFYFSLKGIEVECWRINEFFIDRVLPAKHKTLFPNHSLKEVQIHYRDKWQAQTFEDVRLGTETLYLVRDVESSMPQAMMREIASELMQTVGGYELDMLDYTATMPNGICPLNPALHPVEIVESYVDADNAMFVGFWEKWLNN